MTAHMLHYPTCSVEMCLASILEGTFVDKDCGLIMTFITILSHYSIHAGGWLKSKMAWCS